MNQIVHLPCVRFFESCTHDDQKKVIIVTFADLIIIITIRWSRYIIFVLLCSISCWFLQVSRDKSTFSSPIIGRNLYCFLHFDCLPRIVKGVNFFINFDIGIHLAWDNAIKYCFLNIWEARFAVPGLTTFGKYRNSPFFISRLSILSKRIYQKHWDLFDDHSFKSLQSLLYIQTEYIGIIGKYSNYAICIFDILVPLDIATYLAFGSKWYQS